MTAVVRDQLQKIAETNPAKVIWVDSRVRIERFRKMTLKPNEQEANAASMALFGEVDYQRLCTHAASRLMFVTMSSKGVLVVENGHQILVPARVTEKPVDITGAGDSFSAGAAVALAVTGSACDAAAFANLIASITIMKPGTGTASPAEVLAAAHA